MASRTRSTRGTDGGGFEPPVPFGTHAFQACTINHSVTHPSVGSASYSIHNFHASLSHCKLRSFLSPLTKPVILSEAKNL